MLNCLELYSYIYSCSAFLFSGETIGMYYHDDPVYGINVHPEDNNVFLTASDDGKVMLWDIRTSPVSGKIPLHMSVRSCQMNSMAIS